MSISQKRQYNDTQLFVDGMQFLKKATDIVKNMDRDYKMQYGNEFIIDIRNMITDFSMSYKYKNHDEKLKYGLSAEKLVERIDIDLRILFESGVITEKQNIDLSFLLGKFINQLKGWVRSIGGDSEYADGVSETTNTKPETNADCCFMKGLPTRNDVNGKTDFFDSLLKMR